LRLSSKRSSQQYYRHKPSTTTISPYLTDGKGKTAALCKYLSAK
jgi:hypothetical protein